MAQWANPAFASVVNGWVVRAARARTIDVGTFPSRALLLFLRTHVLLLTWHNGIRSGCQLRYIAADRTLADDIIARAGGASGGAGGGSGTPLGSAIEHTISDVPMLGDSQPVEEERGEEVEAPPLRLTAAAAAASSERGMAGAGGGGAEEEEEEEEEEGAAAPPPITPSMAGTPVARPLRRGAAAAPTPTPVKPKRPSAAAAKTTPTPTPRRAAGKKPVAGKKPAVAPKARGGGGAAARRRRKTETYKIYIHKARPSLFGMLRFRSSFANERSFFLSGHNITALRRC
jgi:hypothetical protein